MLMMASLISNSKDSLEMEKCNYVKQRASFLRHMEKLIEKYF